jgi:hypothetical protein
MRNYAILVGALLILTSMGTMVSADVGYDNPLAVFITMDDQEWDVGSDLDITVHVFNDGEYYDPDFVNLTVGDMEREVNLTRESTGLYTVTITVLEDDVDYDGDLGLQVIATDEGPFWPDMAWDFVYLYGGGGGDEFMVFTYITDNSGSNAKPGQTIHVSIETTFSGEPVDPDNLDVYVYDMNYDDVTYDLNKVGTGMYELTFEIPEDLGQSGDFEVGAEAEYSTGGNTYYDDDWTWVEVLILNVWIHYVELTETRTEIEYFVMDIDGMPIEGADVDIDYYYYDDSWDEVNKDDSATTDENGMVSFVLTYNDLGEDEYSIELEVYFDTGDIEDSYWDTLYVKDYVPGDDWGFVVDVPRDGLDPDSDVNLQLEATYDGDPMALQDIAIYVVTDEEILFYGTERTGVSGGFDIDIHTPSTSGTPMDPVWIDVYFMTQYIGEWESYEEYLIVGEGFGDDFDLRDMIDPGTTLTVAPFRAGETAEVTLECTAADGADEEAFIIWFAGTLDNFVESDTSEWGIMGSWGADVMLGEFEATWSDGSYHASIPIPIIMDPDTPLTFLGAVGFPDMMSMNIKLAYKEGVFALPPNEPPIVAISFPVEGHQYSGALMMEGSAGDDKAVESVEYRVDGGVWNEVEGTTTWSLELDTTELTPGTHQVEVRAYDGEEWSILDDVVFEVDQPPEISLTTPITGSLDGLWTFIGNALDDNDVDKVEYQIDDGTWFTATGTDDWSFELDTTMFTSDDHVLKLRASDGERFSLEVDFDFTINQIPLVAITGHVEGKLFKDKVKFEGTASDDIAVVAVEIRIDSGDWIDLGALAAWTYKAPSKDMEEGNHSLEVRVWDGEKYSDIEDTYFNYEVSEEPGFGLIAALMAVLVAIPMVRWRMQGRE